MEDMAGNKCFSRFRYNFVYVLYLFVTDLPSPPRINTNLEETVCRDERWVELAEDSVHCRSWYCGVKPSGSIIVELIN
jgi:hypothetical protein